MSRAFADAIRTAGFALVVELADPAALAHGDVENDGITPIMIGEVRGTRLRIYRSCADARVYYVEHPGEAGEFFIADADEAPALTASRLFNPPDDRERYWSVRDLAAAILAMDEFARRQAEFAAGGAP